MAQDFVTKWPRDSLLCWNMMNKIEYHVHFFANFFFKVEFLRGDPKMDFSLMSGGGSFALDQLLT